MDRRLIGALLVAAVVAAATVIPARDGLRISGDPIAIELPSDPKVGDCVFTGAGNSDVKAGTLDRSTFTTLSANEVESRGPDSVVIGKCNGQPSIGEIAEIRYAHVDGDSLRPPTEDCRGAGLRYAGLVPADGGYALPDHSTTDPVQWNFSLDLPNAWMLPSAPLQAAGKEWAACVIAAGSLALYQGRILGAYNGGRLPDEFGTCWDAREISAAIHAVDCGQPHVAELMAIGSVHDRTTTTPARISNSCNRLAARVLGRTDPTAAGGLAVQVSPEFSDTAPRTTESLTIVCFVVPVQQSLTGTLVGLGDRPLPLSS